MGRGEIAAKIPHDGAMCLLDGVIAWDRDRITCRATSHRDRANPLARNGTLSAVAGLEYGAQAMALHGALTGIISERPRVGMIASARALRWSAPRLDDLAAPLEVTAQRLGDTGAQVSYEIAVRCAGRDILTGRVMALLRMGLE